MIQQIGNALGAYKPVTDFRTGVDSEGEMIAYGGIYIPFRANAAIARGALVAFVVPTASAPLSVKERANADLFTMTAGVAMNAATAADQIVTVCVFGQCLVNVGSGTPAAGNYGVHSATTGIVGPASAAIDASTVNLLGVFQGVKTSDDRCGFWFNPR
jgi:hypothetical protein